MCTESHFLGKSVFALATVFVASLPLQAELVGAPVGDDTAFLQKKLDSGARRIVLPRRSRPYSVESLALRSNTELVLEEGVIIEARKGSFVDRFATLLTLRETTNAVVRGLGAGATIRMHRGDYRKPPYAASEYRHAFNLLGVRQVTLENLTISSSGGDGVYVGAVKRNCVWRDCENLTVRNCRIEDNNRQAISVISAKGLRVENCRLLRTYGALPMAGVDFEPNDPGQRLVDCLFRECEIAGNAREGVFFATGNLKARSTPVSIRFEDCRFSGNGAAAVNVTPSASVRPEDAVGGRAEFVRCTFDCSRGERGIVVERKTSRCYRVVFTDCTLVEPADDWKGHVAVELGAGAPGEPFADGFSFDRLTVRQPSLRPWCRLERENYSRIRPSDWRGTVTRVAPDGTQTEDLDAAWCAKAFPPPPDETLPRIAGDFSKAAVVDPHPGEMRPLSPFAVRMHGRFVFFAARAGRVVFRYRYDRMPDYPNEFPKLSLSLLDLGGRMLRAFEPQACSSEDRTLVCDVPSSGFYRLASEASAYAALTFLASDAPFAIDTSAERLEAVYSSGSLRFHVPAGRRAGFFLSNDPGECVNVTVSDSSGCIRLDLADFSDVLRREQLPASKADGFWRVDFAKSAKSRLRKFHFHLIGVAGCLFPDPERGWRF